MSAPDVTLEADGVPGRFIATAGESRWVARETPSFYGRTPPPGRKYWVDHVGTGTPPAHLRGIVGFYAPTIEAVRAILAGSRAI